MASGRVPKTTMTFIDSASSDESTARNFLSTHPSCISQANVSKPLAAGTLQYLADYCTGFVDLGIGEGRMNQKGYAGFTQLLSDR